MTWAAVCAAPATELVVAACLPIVCSLGSAGCAERRRALTARAHRLARVEPTGLAAVRCATINRALGVIAVGEEIEVIEVR
ncbi:MAG TPA: hypothetical protein VFU01_03250 [Gemmatimonadaceae bacterium]|nr:hypothetical protein [Gemmatimonadaceae bacterium]